MDLNTLHKHRFEIFFFSLICVLFGSLFFPKGLFATYISPILFLINILSGLLFFIKKLRLIKIVSGLFIVVFSIFLINVIKASEDSSLRYLRLIIYFLFYCVVTISIIKQVWSATAVDKSVIFGLMSGYISIGLIGFFTFYCIELAIPGSFNGIPADLSVTDKIEELLYFSYITVLTIGYGDIAPYSEMARKAAVLFGMIGQFYMVIITAVVIEKYIRHTHES